MVILIRSSIVTLFCALFLVAPPRPADAAPIAVTDIAGRHVTLPGPAQRIVLAEGRQIVALALIHPDPVSLLAGWLGDFRRNDSGSFALYRDKFPAIETLPVIGRGNDGTLSAEKIIALKPDLVVLGLGVVPTAGNSDIVRQLDAAGIPVVFTDFFVDPFVHALPSMRILGQVTGRTGQAEAYIAFYQAHMDHIAARLAKRSGAQPKILVEAHAGMAGCCFSPGHGSIGRYIAFAGGHSIGVDVLTGATGHLSLEYVIAQDPEIYVATGGAYLAATGGLVIGPGFDDAAIRRRLSDVAHRPGIAGLRAVHEGRVHGLFHNMLATPLNILATEALAKWINPDLFADLDPDKTEAEINARFLAVPLKGTYWIDLK